MSVKRTRRQVEPAAAQASRPSSDRWIYVVLVLLVAALYAPTATHEFLNYGDPEAVIDNTHVRDGLTGGGLAWAFASARNSGWIPLTWISHMADCQIFPLPGTLHHVTNLALHGISTLLLFGFFKRLSGARWPSAFVAFVFAVHPLQVESVAWIAERKTLLSGLFWILALWAYLRVVERRSLARYAIVAAMTACALMSSPAAAMLPVSLLLLDYWPLGRLSSGAAKEKIPLAVMAAIALIAAPHTALAARMANAVAGCGMGIWRFIVPAGLTVTDPGAMPAPWQIAAAAVLICGITAFVLRAATPFLVTGWFWYVAGSLTGNTYIGVIGLAIMVGWGLADRVSRPIATAAATACAAWGVMAWIEIGHWQNSVSLFQHGIDVSKNNALAYERLGAALRDQGRLAESIPNFEAAAALRPEDPGIQENFGKALARLGKFGEAAAHLDKAPQAHITRGDTFLRAGSPDRAETEFRAALAIDRDDARAGFGLGCSLAQQNRAQDARPLLQNALPYLGDEVRIKPYEADAHYDLGLAYALLGRTDDAIGEFSTATRLQPDDADSHFQLGLALEQRDRLLDAFGEMAAGVRLRPDHPTMLFQFARLLVRVNRPKEAMAHLHHLLSLAPNYPEARDMFEGLQAVHDPMHVIVYPDRQ